MRIAIVEDEPEARRQLARFVAQYGAEMDLEAEVIPLTSGEELLACPLEQVDLVLLDIQMQGLDGMETARRLRRMGSGLSVIFVTSLAQYAVHGYQVDAVDFLVKPVTYPVFKRALSHYQSRCAQHAPRYLTLRGREGALRIPVQELAYAEVFGHQVLLHRRSGQQFSYSGTLTALERQLPEGEFFRCHSSYLVNLSCVEETGADSVTAAGQVLPVSKHRRRAFLAALAACWGRSL